jgi:Fe-S-cluster containining protein
MPAFECDSCGECCRRLIIEIDELDLIREPRLIQVSTPFRLSEGEHLVDEDNEPCEEQVPGYGAGAMLACGTTMPCGMLGPDNRCQVYPTRPNVCVAFRAGSEQCQDARQQAGLSPLLPKVRA